MGTILFKLINYKVESQFMNKKPARALKKFIYFPNTAVWCMSIYHSFAIYHKNHSFSH